MSSVLELAGRAFLPDGLIHPRSIVIHDGLIDSVDEIESGSGTAESDDHLIVPAFVDLHVHGGAGHDFSDADQDGVLSILEYHGQGGTAALAATIVSSPPEPTLRAITAIANVNAGVDGAAICAIHLEGPFLNQERCGAQNPRSIRRPDTEEVDSWLTAAGSLPLVVTIAPDAEDAIELISRYPEIRFSIGHTSADYRTTLRAFEAGARQVTHLFNAMPGLHHRAPGLVGAALLSPDVVVEMIADGHHVHPAVLQIVSRWMPEQMILVTDAIAAAGSPDAACTLGGLNVQIEGGAARLADGTLAGSVITMREALVTMVERAGVPIERVLRMMTHIPAKAIGIDSAKGAIAPGMDADLLVLDSRLRIVRRIVRGHEA